MFFKTGVFNNFGIFTETHLCWSLFFKKLQVKLFKKKLQHMCFPVNIEKFVRAAFLIKHVWWLLLKNPWNFQFIWKIGYCLTCLLLGFLKLCYFFCLHYWNSALWCFIAIFYKLPLCQLQTVHLVDSLKIGERHAESNTFLCSVVH